MPLKNSMNNFRLSDLLDLTSIQKMADSHYRAASMPIGIIDAIDSSILVGAGWQDICSKFHRVHPESLKRCQESDDFIKDRLVRGQACSYKCKHGLWDIGIPIIVAGRHLATMFLGQFFYENEAPDRNFFTEQADRYGFDLDRYLQALDRVPVFSREKVEYIIEYDKALVDFISDLAEHALQKIHQDEIIRESEHKFQAIFEQAFQFIGLLSLDGRVLQANRTALDFCGVQEKDVSGMLFWDTPWWRHSPDLQAKLKQAIRQAARGQMVAFEAEYLDLTGAPRYFDFSVKPVTDEAGKVTMLIPEARDITGRKQAEEKIKQQAEFFQRLIDAMPYPVFYKDRQGLYMSCNRAFEIFYGVQREQIAGKTVYAVASRERADRHMQIDRELFEHPGDRMYETCVQSADGTSHDVIFHKATFPGSDSAVAGLVGAMLDITDRRRIERALEESEAKIRSIMDNVGVGVALIGPKMEILEMNRMMRRWFPTVQLHEQPLCYRAFNDPPREQVCDYCPTYKTLQDGKVHEATTQTRQAGTIRNFRVVASPIFNASGQVLAAIELVDDITEKLSLESQLRQAQKMEAVGRLAGGVAHDFNNMLSVILGYAELALYKLDGAHPVHAKLEQIRDAAKRSTDIIRQLLAFARKQTIAPQMLDLNEAVEGILKMLRRLIGEDIDLVWRSDSGLWPVKMDPTQIEQILANLCVNARDAIQGVGKITIETSNIRLDEAYCEDHAGFRPGHYAMLAVSDDGCGMDPDTLDKIFEPFFTTKGVGRGTGLGLSTVYGIVKQNDGFVNVYSEKDKGTTFRIYFPGHRGPISELSREDDQTLMQGAGETILVVEDEGAVLDLTHSMLEGLGYAVMSAGSPEAAVRQAESFDGEIHLLITDVIMPGMNGKDVAEKIRQTRPSMKLLFMSGYTANVIAHRSMLDPGVQFISKPFTIQQLSVKVHKVLEKTG
jgi:two-component system cell cycle sensor histidine kinase/response regulator CckA